MRYLEHVFSKFFVKLILFFKQFVLVIEFFLNQEHLIVESIVVHNSDWPTGTQVICTLDAPVVSQAARTDIHDSFVRILAVNPEVVSQVNLYTSN